MITKEFLLSNLASAALHGALLVGAGATAQYSVATAPTAMEISLRDYAGKKGPLLRDIGGEQVSHRGVVPEARAPFFPVIAKSPKGDEAISTEIASGPAGPRNDKTAGSDVTSLKIGARSQTHSACPQVNPPPLYPRAARRQGIEGKVVLSVAINAAGKVDTVTIASSSGSPILDEAARDGVRRWIFAPARRLGVPVSSQMKIPIIFQLKD